MDISNIANLINAIAVTAGVIFAAVQIRQYQKRRQRDAMLELVRSFQSPAFTAALRRVLSLPDGADAAKIREVLGPDGEDAVYLVSLTWESLGVLVFRREVTLDLVDDFFSGPLIISWQKLKVYSEEWRRNLHRETGNEWFHWLAERMVEREKASPPVPVTLRTAAGANHIDVLFWGGTFRSPLSQLSRPREGFSETSDTGTALFRCLRGQVRASPRLNRDALVTVFVPRLSRLPHQRSEPGAAAAP